MEGPSLCLGPFTQNIGGEWALTAPYGLMPMVQIRIFKKTLPARHSDFTEKINLFLHLFKVNTCSIMSFDRNYAMEHKYL